MTPSAPRAPWRPGRAGHTLPELMVALFLAGIVGAVVIALFTSSTTALRQLVVRSEHAETRRTVAALLLEELSVGVQGRDWWLDGDRAVSLRAFRGYARVCAWAPATSVLTVAWRGQRAPDPGRDSVLVLAAGGDAAGPSAWVPADLAWVGASPDPEACGPGPPGGERVAGWRVAGIDPSGALLLRFFEQGRYSLEDGAFRYRQGTAGRQPLTPEVVGRGSRIRAWAGPGEGPGGGPPGLEVELHVGESAPVGIDRWRVQGDPAGPWGRPLRGTRLAPAGPAS